MSTMKCEPNQSSRWPLSSTTCRAPKPSASSPRPMKSTRNVLLLFFFMYGGSVISRLVSSMEMMPTGILMKKIQRQLKLSVIQPPSVGPIAGASTTAMPYTANAMPRLRGSKVSARIACSLGCRPPPPAPCNTRQIINVARFGASPQRNELIVNNATQDM